MTYHLGHSSRNELDGVHPDLVAVVERAIEITEQDFSVADGLRTVEEQRENVERGVSKTMNSKHLPQDDGYGHAVDLVPYIDGKLQWEWQPIYVVARAMKQAAEELGVHLRWGGFWGQLDGDDRDPEQMRDEYIARRKRLGRRVFVDGPHYELLPG